MIGDKNSALSLLANTGAYIQRDKNPRDEIVCSFSTGERVERAVLALFVAKCWVYCARSGRVERFYLSEAGRKEYERLTRERCPTCEQYRNPKCRNTHHNILRYAESLSAQAVG